MCSHLSGCSWPEQNFGDIPVDLLVCFVRGYAHEANWAGETRRLLADALRWRSKERADSAIASGPPARRVQWEAAWPSGPIGHDREGRAVVVDRSSVQRALSSTAIRSATKSNSSTLMRNAPSSHFFTRPASHEDTTIASEFVAMKSLREPPTSGFTGMTLF